MFWPKCRQQTGLTPLKYAEERDKTSQYSYVVVILSNWVPDHWVYRLPIIPPSMWNLQEYLIQLESTLSLALTTLIGVQLGWVLFVLFLVARTWADGGFTAHPLTREGSTSCSKTSDHPYLAKCCVRSSTSKAQTKHTKNFSIKNFGPPKNPPPKFFIFGLFPVFWREKRPQT